MSVQSHVCENKTFITINVYFEVRRKMLKREERDRTLTGITENSILYGS